MIRVILLTALILMLIPATSSGYDFGTKVMPDDTDMGEPLFDIPGGTAVGFWDIGTPGYDEADPVYLHIARLCRDVIIANDVRLTSIANYSPGSKVKFDDIDMNRPLTLLPATMNYLNIYGSQAYDLDDPVYLHQYYCGGGYPTGGYEYPTGGYEQEGEASDYESQDERVAPIKIEDFEMRLPYRGGISVPGVSCIEFSDGFRLLISDLVVDPIPKAVRGHRGLKVEVICGARAKYYHILDTWLMKIVPVKADDRRFSEEEAHDFDAGFSPLAALICTNDIRLCRIGNLSPGTKVLDFDPDQNKMLASPALARFFGRDRDSARIRYLDRNGNAIYDYPDYVYLNYPSGRSGDSVVVNNVRLTPVNASPGA